MSIISVIGIMLAVLAGIVLLCLAVTRMEKTAKSSEYDERQQLVRGRGHRLVNMVGFAYMLLILPELIRQVEGEKNVEAYLLVFGGFMLLTVVFHVYCFINHAAMPLSSKPPGCDSLLSDHRCHVSGSVSEYTALGRYLPCGPDIHGHL